MHSMAIFQRQVAYDKKIGAQIPLEDPCLSSSEFHQEEQAGTQDQIRTI